MGNTLKMQCPSCGNYDNSECLETFPKYYRWSDETTPLFERIAGQDLSFRKRTRQCSHCGHSFPTVEMSRHYLAAMIEEILRLTGEVNRLTWSKQSWQNATQKAEAKTKTLEAENQLLLEENRIMKAKLKAIDDIAKTEVSERESFNNIKQSS